MSHTADVLDDVLPKVPYVRDPKSLVTVDLTILAIKYNAALEKICNDLAPMKSLWITHRPHAPWYNDDLRLAKRIERRVERMFRKTGLEVHKEIFAEACNKYQRQLEFHKSSCYKSKIERAGKNKLFRMSTNFFNLAAQPFLPIHLWTYWSKISTTSLWGRSNPLETNSRMQSTTQCNLSVGFWLTNSRWRLCPALALRTLFSLFPQKHVLLTHFPSL